MKIVVKREEDEEEEEYIKAERHQNPKNVS